MQSLRILAESLKKIRANGRVIWLPFALKFAAAAAALILPMISHGTVWGFDWRDSEWWSAFPLVVALSDLTLLSDWPTMRARGPFWLASYLVAAWLLDGAILAALATTVLHRRMTGFFRTGLAFAGRMIRINVLQVMLVTMGIALFKLYSPYAYNPASSWGVLLLVMFLCDLWGDYSRGLIVADRLSSVILAGLSAVRFMLKNPISVLIISAPKALQLLLMFCAALRMVGHHAAPWVPAMIWLYTLAKALHYAAVLGLLDTRPGRATLYTES